MLALPGGGALWVLVPLGGALWVLAPLGGGRSVGAGEKPAVREGPGYHAGRPGR